MKTHLHICTECGLEWSCYDLECAGVHEMFCDECALEQDLAEEDPPANRAKDLLKV